MGILLALLIWMACVVAPPAVLAAPGGGTSTTTAIRLNNKGVDSYNAGRYEESIVSYNEAIRLNPKYTEAYSNRGAAYDALNNPERAVQDYTAAIQLSPKLTAAYSNRASAYGDLGNFKAAIVDWNLVIRRTPGDPIAYNGRGNCYKSLGDLPAALKDFEKAIKLRPGYQRALKNRDAVRQSMAAGMLNGPAGAGQAQTARAVQDGRATHGVAPTQSPAAVVQPPAAVVQSPAATAVQPQTATAVQPQTAMPGQPQTATAAPAVAPSGPVAVIENAWHHVVGNLYYACGNYGLACEQYSQAFATNPHDVFALYRRANALLAIGQLDFALTDYDTARAINPKFNPAYVGRQKVQSLLNARRAEQNTAPVSKGVQR